MARMHEEPAALTLSSHVPGVHRLAAGTHEIFLAPPGLISSALALPDIPALRTLPQLPDGRLRSPASEGWALESEQALSAPLALALAARLAEALEALHQRGQAFGLLHPGAVWVDLGGQLRLRPALHWPLLPDPESPGPAADCMAIGALIRFWTTGQWAQKETPLDRPRLDGVTGARLDLLVAGLCRARWRLRITPARSVGQAIRALLHGDGLDGEALLRAELLRRGLLQEQDVPTAPQESPAPPASVEELASLPPLAEPPPEVPAPTPAPQLPAAEEEEDTDEPTVTELEPPVFEPPTYDPPGTLDPVSWLSVPPPEPTRAPRRVEAVEEEPELPPLPFITGVPLRRVVEEPPAAAPPALPPAAPPAPSPAAQAPAAVSAPASAPVLVPPAAPPPPAPTPPPVLSPAPPVAPEGEAGDLLSRPSGSIEDLLSSGRIKVTANSERERELGAGKWTEVSRSREELQRQMPDALSREIQVEEPSSFKPRWLLVLLPALALPLWLLLRPDPSPEQVPVITLTSAPSGARVTLDGAELGVTPLSLPLPQDEAQHQLCADLNGAQSCQTITASQLATQPTYALRLD